MADGIQRLAERDMSFLQTQLSLALRALLEANRRRSLNVVQEVLDDLLTCLLERGEKVRFEDLGPRTGDLPSKGVSELDIEILAPGSKPAQS